MRELGMGDANVDISPDGTSDGWRVVVRGPSIPCITIRCGPASSPHSVRAQILDHLEAS